MKYKELLKKLKGLTEEQMNQSVTVEISGEFYPIKNIRADKDEDVLDTLHPVLTTSSFE